MSLFKQFKTDNTKETQGIKVEFPEASNENGTIPTFVISRMGSSNKAYQKALEATTRPYRRQIELGTLSNEKSEEIFLEVFVNTVLKGWQNVEDASGKPLVFNRDNAKFVLKELPDVYARLQEEAKIASNFRADSLESDAKN